jgi:hypothetical protein
MFPRPLNMAIAALALIATGCDGWPPRERELTRLYTENSDHFRSIMTTMSSAGLIAVSHGADATAVNSSSDPQEIQTENDTPQGRELRKQLEHSDLWAVYDDDGVYFFEPYFSSEDDQHWYRARIVFDPGDTPLDSCSSIKERGERGTCKVALADDHWSIRYAWFPHGDD